MATDLTDNSELDEEEFDWDVFLPDPDEAEIAAEAAALDDEADLDLDDSDLDWEAAFHDDSDREPGTDGSARAGAAFDRIVDTVRGSFDEPEPETVLEPEAEQESEAELAPEVELVYALATELEPETTEEIKPEAALESEVDPALTTEAESEADLELEAESEADLELEVELEPEAETETSRTTELESEDDSEPFEEMWADIVPQPASKHVLAADFGPEEDPRASEVELEPVAAPPAEPNAVAVAMATVAATAPEPIVSFEPVPEAPEMPEWPWDDDGQSDTPRGPSHARTRKRGERQRRSRVFTVTVVLACLFAGVVAAAAVVRSMHHSTATTPPAAHSTSHTSSTAGATRIQTATDAVDSATTSARAGLTSLSSFPTPANVATQIHPYISSLQLYEAFLQGRSVPEPARPMAASAEAQVRRDLKFLGTIDGLPPLQLGAYLQQFETNATQLQTTLSALEQSLGTPTS